MEVVMAKKGPKETPVLFSGAMVRALLDGRKTLTRRIIRTQESSWEAVWPLDDFKGREFFAFGGKEEKGLRKIVGTAKCPLGTTGDLLWVRETVRAENLGDGKWRHVYVADGTGVDRSQFDHLFGDKNMPMRNSKLIIPSIHMPRWANRLWLEIKDVRAERLQDITEEDAMAEGIIKLKATGRFVYTRGAQHAGLVYPTAVEAYRGLWESLYNPESWEANPWVWAVSFGKL
jgi:hypothetical protein